MKSGTVKLIRGREIIKQAAYYSASGRKNIIKTWNRIIGLKFEECAIHIVPDIDKRYKE